MATVLRDFLQRSVDLYRGTTLETLDALTADELAYRPAPAQMPIGVLAWHVARVHDLLIQTRTRNVDQLWVADGWGERFGRLPARRGDTGFGFGEAELDEFELPESSLLVDYLEATWRITFDEIAAHDDASLDATMIAGPLGGELSLADLFRQLLWESNQHIGQMAYLRGIVRGVEDPHRMSPVWTAAAERSA